jgi:mannose-1-phosphate guanylyltransferase
MTKVYAVIMAGGRGERFWPLSTQFLPKPFIPLLGSRTLIQQTVDRLLPLIPADQILISIGESHQQIAREQLRQIPVGNFIVEPVGRDTAPCLAFCGLHIEQRDPDATMLALPSDHYIAEETAFRRTLEAGIRALPGATGVVFGILPDRPETGYGYIQTHPADQTGETIPVIRFVEKPDVERAREYVAAGNYYWNSGMFLWRNRTLLDLFKQHMPDLHEKLQALRPLIGLGGSSTELHERFAALPRISIDFGIMEKTSGLRLVPARFAWDDIGSWAALERALPHDKNGNVAIGPHLSLESNHCALYSDSGVIAAFGVSDLIVVQAHGKVLVCPKNRAAGLKNLIAKLDHES